MHSVKKRQVKLKSVQTGFRPSSLIIERLGSLIRDTSDVFDAYSLMNECGLRFHRVSTRCTLMKTCIDLSDPRYVPISMAIWHDIPISQRNRPSYALALKLFANANKHQLISLVNEILHQFGNPWKLTDLRLAHACINAMSASIPMDLSICQSIYQDIRPFGNIVSLHVFLKACQENDESKRNGLNLFKSELRLKHFKITPVTWVHVIACVSSQDDLEWIQNECHEIHSSSIILNAILTKMNQWMEWEETFKIFENSPDSLPNEQSFVLVMRALTRLKWVEKGRKIWKDSIINRYGFNNNHLNCIGIDFHANAMGGKMGLKIAKEIYENNLKLNGFSYHCTCAWMHGLIGNGYAEEGVKLFEHIFIQSDSNGVATSIALKGLAMMGDFKKGMEIHEKWTNVPMPVHVVNGFISFFAKCIRIDLMKMVFDEFKSINGYKNTPLSTYAAMMSGFAMHGHLNECKLIWNESIHMNLNLNDWHCMFLSFLSACAHRGASQMAIDLFESWKKNEGNWMAMYHDEWENDTTRGIRSKLGCIYVAMAHLYSRSSDTHAIHSLINEYTRITQGEKMGIQNKNDVDALKMALLNSKQL